MIQMYIGNSLAYDSRLEEYDLLALKVTTGTNKGGSASITMPPQHPAYSSFVSFKSIVTIYRDNVLLFRGRPLYPTDDFLKRRTITCEGERCFFRDAVSRPYDYSGTPASVFTSVLGVYNAQVESDKQFVVGSITVTDSNDYIRLYTETPEQLSDTIDKLVERCGGYIVFTTNQSNQRVVNWYATSAYQSSQTIEFGENLLDFTRSANTDIATRIIPYGAKDETTGQRITIESVNSGVDYVEDSEAVALRGIIAKSVIWDDVTVPTNLKTKANAYLAQSKMIVTTLQVSAVDLAAAGQNIDRFQVGDNVHVISTPHGFNDWMLLETLTEDLLDPSGSTISLGKSYLTLTGEDVAGDRQSRSDLENQTHVIRSDYTRDLAVAVAETERKYMSEINQTSTSIQSRIAEEYVTNDQLTASQSTLFTQLSDSFTMQFDTVNAKVDANDTEARTQFEEIHKYIRFDNGDIILGESGNQITLRIENDRISFLDSGAEVAYFSNNRLYVLDGEFINSLQLGNFAFLPRANGNLSFQKVVG